MTKSQNTKNEQQKDLCITSEQLTEQWKKGKLPSGWYYVRLIRGEYRIDLYINGKNEWIDCPDNIIDNVVCEVPSYDEWLEKTKSLKVLAEAYCKEKQQNKQLKELLARAKGIITAYRLTGNQSTYSDNDMKECVAKIDEALR